MTSRFVLASASPRRRALLAEAGFEFEVVSPATPEIFTHFLTLREITLCNATRKAMAAARERPDAIVLAADTLVALEGEVIGKPVDLEDAISILRRLSGQTHEVCTAVYIRDGRNARARSFSEISSVRFRSLSNRTIRDYIRKINPFDKAGAYAAQGDGAKIIAGLDGSFTNVVGLPMEKTSRALSYFGIEPCRAQRRSASSGSSGAGV